MFARGNPRSETLASVHTFVPFGVTRSNTSPPPGFAPSWMSTNQPANGGNNITVGE